MRVGAALALVLVTILAVRAFDAWRAPPLSLWHSQAPQELDAAAINAADWRAWESAEARVFDDVLERVSLKLPTTDRVAANRYFVGSPLHASHFAQDWNRSFTWMPRGKPRGAAVLLHGLTDSPYSLRHIGAFYLRSGFMVVAVRMPGHGTVPAGLTRVRWEDWAAATRLAVRHARAQAGDVPLHLVGYSNGAALALDYALATLDDDTLARPEQLVLFSPMVGITSVARFAGILGWPAALPGFAKAAWLATVPEYNPFKYNSFPVNGARQSSQLVRAVQKRLLARAEQGGGFARFPRLLVFQSAIDATVSTQAVLDLFAQLADPRSELVLFDANRAAVAGPLVNPASTAWLDGVLAHAARPFTLTLVTGSAANPAALEARRFAPGAGASVDTPLAHRYPDDMYSLSHVALPFPMDDALYGREPRADEFYGVRLGAVAVRGERGTLLVDVETLMRATSNPFFDYQLEKIAELLPVQQPGLPTGQ